MSNSYDRSHVSLGGGFGGGLGTSSNKSQSAFALIKFFSQEEHYLSFISGTSLFRTPHHYRTCEDTGRGDRNESCILYWNKKVGGNKPRLEKQNGENLINQNSESVLVYPSNEPHDAWMQSWAVIGPHNNFDDSLEQMQREFGCYFVLLPAGKIEHYARLVEKVAKTQVSYGLVSYTDDPMERSLTVKDSKYSYQKEFRFFWGGAQKGRCETSS